MQMQKKNSARARIDTITFGYISRVWYLVDVLCGGLNVSEFNSAAMRGTPLSILLSSALLVWVGASWVTEVMA